ncbi:16S rRNA (cytosine(1402)-N(4))-methyltransferase RsmH [Roseobacter sp. N2S]|uniref:16S rRNA (cytosine(1402)-N(4))-methyltransferase RsmH n=1 Tax=Roseobacter sp. N2S TaxID=2663844 RepID=UPI00285FCD88|nr:16S rRNA (cytosine(1402)-N(4))-methyltransferase RsmH [Roseobacter sp. N2S]MDR6264128.1 16S rRNA (cytosine1402-N4)-methyltransferase [Roseobacter sp. N2S]
MEQVEPTASPHIPVLLAPILSAVAPMQGRWVDGTFGAGGYTRAFLDAGADTVFAIDRDPEVFVRAADWAGTYGDRLQLIEGTFGNMEALLPGPVDGVVLDIGVSSMQIDQAERGFSFQKDGPLDMRMSQSGQTAADVVNTASEAELADIFFQYGEERASRRIATAVVAARKQAPILTTARLVEVIESTMPKGKPGMAHPATRTFQALRIAVNDELGQLVRGLYAAESVLAAGGVLAVVTFHSLEDRIVKRFLAARAGMTPKGNRWAPEENRIEPQFELLGRKAITADKDELAVNPRSRSAKLRLARRTDAPVGDVDFAGLGLPRLSLKSVSQ